MLHITNGDSAAEGLRGAALPSEILPWRDALHEGPVPLDLGFRELSELRARHFAQLGWGVEEELIAESKSREVTLTRALEGDEIVLWFEHDLYDQLQLVQILSWFAEIDIPARLSLICIDTHPAVERFIGLGQLSSVQLADLFPARERVTPGQLDLARRAWAAFRAPVPTVVEELIRGDTSPLPFLGAALRRHLAQFPGTETGLSRTELQILEVVAAGVRSFDRVFRASQDLEEAPFLGDLGLWTVCQQLATGPQPLLSLTGDVVSGTASQGQPLAGVLELTEAGRAVLRRQADWIRLRGGIDRWLGGVHLQGEDSPWRWDPRAELLVARDEDRR